jgi:hypothetical protein
VPEPEAVAAIVMEFEAGVIVIPVPAVNDAAAGLPAVLPTKTCPSVNAIQVGTPVEFDVKAALAVVDNPETALVVLA